jgi:nucleoside-diphosphate-sugar epimerase
MTKILVVGGDSTVGKALVEQLFKFNSAMVTREISYTTRRAVTRKNQLHLDLSNPVLPEGDWDLIYLVAAITGIMGCEVTSESWRVNADGPAQLALQASKQLRMRDMAPGEDYNGHVNASPHVVFISSDAVELAPGLAYSMQKAYAESVILPLGGTVVRPARIFPEKLDNLVELLIDVGINRKSGLHRWTGLL